MSSEESVSEAGSAPPEQPRSQTPPMPMLPPGAYPRPPKSPGLALFLSFAFPGAGQIYNGQPAKGFAFFFGFASAIYLAAEVDPMPFALLIPFVVLYNLIDAWKTAGILNARAAGGVVIEDEDGFESPVWGATLLGMGVLLLLNNLGWLDLAAMRRFWPILLIAVGAYFLHRSVRRQDGPDRDAQD